MFDGLYSNQPIEIPKGTNQARKARKYRVYGTAACAVCGASYVTLLQREGRRICRDCYAEVLKIRTETGKEWPE